MEAGSDALTRIIEAAEGAGLDPNSLAAITEVVRLKRVEERLRSTAPDLLLRLERAGEEALGSADRTWRWLRRPQYGLDRQVPLDYVGNGDPERVSEVEAVLDRIAHGAAG
jgi:uncharacterized protein (DUF2384 family)